MGLSLGTSLVSGPETLTQLRQQLHMRSRCHSKRPQAQMSGSVACLLLILRLALSFLIELAPSILGAALESPAVLRLLAFLQP